MKKQSKSIAPRFEVIGGYGVILYGHDNSTQLLATKHQAREIGSTLIDIGITDKQWEIVLKQINESGLSEHDSYLENLVSDMEGIIGDPRPLGPTKIVTIDVGKKHH